MEKREESIARVEASEKELDQQYQECLERAKVAESARFLLEREHGLIQEELASQEHHIKELEGQMDEERSKREEEVGGLREELEQEQRSRDQEAARFSQVIDNLNRALKTKVGKGSTIWHGKGSTETLIID